jgi:phage repressor protein C with HTH and peptisase S24 domain
MDQESIGTRVQQIIDSKGYTVMGFEKFIGAGNNTIGTSIKRNSSFSSSILSKILYSCPEVNPGWLLTGKGHMNQNVTSENNTLSGSKIPFYDHIASAGKVILFKNFNQSHSTGYIHVPNAPKCDGAVPIVGDSMYPLLKSGDIVGYKIKDPSNIIFGEMYLVDWCDGEGDDYLMAKFIAKSTIKDHIRLVSYNKHHDDLDIPIKSIRQLALIKVSIRFNTH